MKLTSYADMPTIITILMMVGVLLFGVKKHHELQKMGGLRGCIISIAKEIIEIHHEMEKEKQ